jgi:carbon monoxide dehydrogenase subunit G
VQIDNTFVVAAPPSRVWELLLDVERVAPCMPGAELTEAIDDRTWKGRVRMRIGPVSMAYTGQVVMVERDDAKRVVTLRAEARELSGKGNAAATVRSSVEPTADGGSRVVINQDLQLSGMAAQFGGRMIQDVSTRLTQQFADCLSAQLSAEPAAAGPAEQANELPGLRLAVWAFVRAVARALHLPSARRGSGAVK